VPFYSSFLVVSDLENYFTYCPSLTRVQTALFPFVPHCEFPADPFFFWRDCTGVDFCCSFGFLLSYFYLQVPFVSRQVFFRFFPLASPASSLFPSRGLAWLLSIFRSLFPPPFSHAAFLNRLKGKPPFQHSAPDAGLMSNIPGGWLFFFRFTRGFSRFPIT